jgi:hypothetical protein
MSGRLRGERGQTSVEYLGVIVVVAVILAGLVAATPGVSSLVGTGLRRAVCLIARSDSCPDAAAKTTASRPAAKPKAHGDGGVWGFLKDRAGDVGGAAKTTGGFLGDVGVGAYDSVKNTLVTGFELSPTRAAIDPDGFFRDAREFGEGTWYGITHPKELGKALIDWPDLTGGHPGKAIGQWLPDIALALLTGGLGSAADGSAEAARGLSRAEKAADSARDLSRAEKAAEAARVAGRAANFSTRSGEAVFWSGLGGEGERVAAEYASKAGGTTLEQLQAARGIKLPKFKFEDPASVKAWTDASRAFAEGARGEVRVVLGDSVNPSGIWNTVELPALEANPNVTSIVSVDPSTGAKTTLWQR